MSIFDWCPVSLDWKVDWQAIRSEYSWVDALHQCAQDPHFHAEGDVGVHTRLVCEALAESPQFQALNKEDREVVFSAALLHDVGKPRCSKLEDDRISSRGHSSRGENMARQILWREELDFHLRESICGLVRHHQIPFFLIDRQDPNKLAHQVSQVVRCDLLALLTWADGCGRRCTLEGDQERMLENVALFRELCLEQDCLESPRQFSSDLSRFQYFQTEGRDPNYHAHDETKCEVILMSGLPAAGKDHWIRKNAPHMPIVSLDSIRENMKISPAASQGRVVAEGREMAKQYLREHQSFVWNATNISRQMRGQLVSLFAAYNAQIRIVYVECSYEEMSRRNRDREKPVPEKVMEKMMGKWTVPSIFEAHRVKSYFNGALL